VISGLPDVYPTSSAVKLRVPEPGDSTRTRWVPEDGRGVVDNFLLGVIVGCLLCVVVSFAVEVRVWGVFLLTVYVAF
jgi:hypothetical protein